MPETQIGNPDAAFQPLSGTLSGVNAGGLPGNPGPQYKEMYNSGASTINAGEWVQLDITGTSGHIMGVVRGVHGGTPVAAIGIAAQAIKAGASGPVVIEGPAYAIPGAAGFTVGNLVVPSTVSTDDGKLINASSAAIGTVIGIALQTGAAGVQTPIWVTKA